MSLLFRQPLHLHAAGHQFAGQAEIAVVVLAVHAGRICCGGYAFKRATGFPAEKKFIFKSARCRVRRHFAVTIKPDQRVHRAMRMNR